MLTAAGPAREGGTTLIIGLSKANIQRLAEKRPAAIEPSMVAKLTERHGPISGVIIFAGTTEESMATMLQSGGIIGPETEAIDRLGPETEIVEAVAKELQAENRARGLGLPGEPSIAEVRRIVGIYLEKARGI